MNGLSKRHWLASIALFAGSTEATAAKLDDLPVVARAKAGPCQMTIYGDNSSFLATVTGLTPNEPLKLTSNSEGEIRRWDGTAQEDGRFGVILIPLVVGKSFGTARFELVGQRCRIEASYPWRE
jgi:hypothetical protein